MKTPIACLASLVFCSAPVFASETDSDSQSSNPIDSQAVATSLSQQKAEEEKPVLNVNTTFRYDYLNTSIDGEQDNANTGFKGRYLQLNISGQVADGLTYSWRQNLNKLNKDASFFNSTDWLYLNYAVDGWNLQAGKLINAIGGYEYDRNPADVFGPSMFWYNIPCFNWGASVGYNFTDSDLVTMQVTQSPFFTTDDRNLYAYNAMWTGNHGVWKTLYSANLNEYLPGKYISYLSLGNRLDIDNVDIEFDFVNRAANHQAFFLKDYSAICEIGWKFQPAWRVFGKMTYDTNKSGNFADFTVPDGTEMFTSGGGIFYTPLSGKYGSVRFHATAFYTWGDKPDSADYMAKNSLIFSAGMTWRINFLNIR